MLEVETGKVEIPMSAGSTIVRIKSEK